MRRIAMLAAVAVLLACGGDDPGSSQPEPTPQPESKPEPTPESPSEPTPTPTSPTPPPTSPTPSVPPTSPTPPVQPSNPAPTTPTFAGTFSGTAHDLTECDSPLGPPPGVDPDDPGPTVTEDTYDASWRISQSGDTANVTTGGNCPPYTADVETSGIVAHFRRKTCSPVIDGDIATRNTLDGGTLTLSGETLDATMAWVRTSIHVPTGQMTEFCVTDTRVRLTRTAP